MKTSITEKWPIKAKSPILVEGLPGLGMVGRIATSYLAKQLNAKKFAFLHSPHFPYYVVVNKKGNTRLLRGEFRYCENSKGDDLILFTGDSQAQTIEGQYEIAETILCYAEKHRVKAIITLGGYRKEAEGTPEVIATATDSAILKQAINAGASLSPPGNPIVGTAGLLVGMSRFRKIPALCLLGETRGYLPDPKSAKSLLVVLRQLLGIDLDLQGLDQEIVKSDKILEKMRQIEARRETYARKMRKDQEGKTTYIS
jgi:uncharacterized protein (TIGR00162 family)